MSPDCDQRPDVTTIVVTHQNSDIVSQCLRAIRLAVERYSNELIVVDNASDDGTADRVMQEEPGAVVLALSENIGFAAANNLALKRARGRYFALVNSDCFPDRGALDVLIEAADQLPAAGLIGGSLRYEDGTHQPSAGQLPTLGSELWLACGFHRVPILRRIGVGLLYSPELYRHPTTVGWVSGAFCLARRAIGEMPARGFMYGEDVEWARQACARGYAVWLDPRAAAIHVGSASVMRSQAADFVKTQRVNSQSDGSLSEALARCSQSA